MCTASSLRCYVDIPRDASKICGLWPEVIRGCLLTYPSYVRNGQFATDVGSVSERTRLPRPMLPCLVDCTHVLILSSQTPPMFKDTLSKRDVPRSLMNKSREARAIDVRKWSGQATLFRHKRCALFLVASSSCSHCVWSRLFNQTTFVMTNTAYHSKMTDRSVYLCADDSFSRDQEL